MMLFILRFISGLVRAIPSRFLRAKARAIWQWWQTRNSSRVAVVQRNGLKYRLHLAETIDAGIYYHGCWEPATTEAIKAFCRKGFHALDIGANIGAHTLLMADLVGHTGSVAAFEPMPWARERLLANVALNEFKWIRVIPLALSDHESLENAHFRSSWTIGSDGVSYETAESLAAHETQFTTLDALVTKKVLPGVDFIKMDVDGYEYRVLRGAQNILRERTPAIVMELSEYSLKRVGDSAQGLLSLLESLGYGFRWVAELSKICTGRDLLEMLTPDSSIDIVAFPTAKA
jgi:FkbM family methyltransferase